MYDVWCWCCVCGELLDFVVDLMLLVVIFDDVDFDYCDGFWVFDDFFLIELCVSFGEGMMFFVDVVEWEVLFKLEYVFFFGLFKDCGVMMMFLFVFEFGVECVVEDFLGNVGVVVVIYVVCVGIDVEIYVFVLVKFLKVCVIECVGVKLV